MATNQNFAVAVVGLAGFQLLNAWNQNAPKLSDLRAADGNDELIRRQLIDADVLVGGTALILGGAISFMTGDNTPLLIMATLFGSVALWNHIVFRSESGRFGDYGSS